MCITDPQAKGAAGALVQKGLVEKGREPYTPIGEPERLGEWVREQMRGEVPRWLETMLSRPEVVRNRAGRIAARGGRKGAARVEAENQAREGRLQRLRKEDEDEREMQIAVEQAMDIDGLIKRAVEKSDIEDQRRSAEREQ